MSSAPLRLLFVAALLIALPFRAMENNVQDTRTMKVLSFNVREWTRDTDSNSPAYWKKRMGAMEMMVKDLDPDVICLQEVLPPAGRYIPDNYRRVGLSVSHPIYVKKPLKASRHRFSIFWDACTVNGTRVVNVHSRWEKKIVARTVNQVNRQLTGCDIACGDWNTSLRNIQEAGLKMESARSMLGIPEDDTFINFSRPEESHGAIDHFFVNGLTPLSYAMITDGYGVPRMSDHYPIVLTVLIPERQD